MKSCKRCVSDIDKDTNRCPYCKEYQIWYKNTMHIWLFFFYSFFIFVYWCMGFIGKVEFYEHQNSFTVTHKSVELSETNEKQKHLLSIKNDTDYNWENLTLEVLSFNNEKYIASTYDWEYRWSIKPQAESPLTIELPKIETANRWIVRIKELKSTRF